MTTALSHHAIDRFLIKMKEGDREAFASLYTLTCKQLYALCYSFFPVREEAEDVLSDSYLKIWKEAPRFKGQSGFAWCYTITKNCCLNHKKQGKENVFVDFEDEKTVNVLGLYQEDPIQEEGQIIAVAKKVLSEREFRIVILHAVSGYAFKDIVNIVGGIEATVRWQYNNALKKVRKEYEKSV